MTPFGLLRQYLILLEGSSSAPGFDPVAMRGRYYLLRCPACGGAKWKVDKEGVPRCQKRRLPKLGHRLGKRRRRRRYELCLTPRPSRSAAVLKGHVQENARRRSGNRRAERIADLGLLFQVLPEEHWRAFSLYGARGSYAAATSAGVSQWPWLGWTESKVRRLVREAKERIEDSPRWNRMLAARERAA